MGNFITDFANSAGGAIKGLTDPIGQFINSFDRSNTAQASSPVPTPDPFLAKGLVKQADGSYLAPMATLPPQMQPTQNMQPKLAPIAPSAPSSGFQFKMGQKDYSGVREQLGSMFKGSPLSQYVDDFISAGNKWGVDPRVLAMVGQIESSGGKNYPTDSNNPFGYLVSPTTGHGVEDVYNGLRNAGFTSVPMAIDRLTRRFSSQYNNGQSAYPQFSAQPSIENLQSSYNANPGERDNYLKAASALAGQYFK